MRDEEIVGLYWQRSEEAIQRTEEKYGRYLLKIALNVLSDVEDSRESVNDTYLKTWESIPPHRPAALPAYLGRITRQTAIDALRARHRKKRRDTEYTLSLDELAECVSGADTPEEAADLHMLAGAIDAYLHSIAHEARTCFVARYFFLDPLRDIAACHGWSESKVKSMLHRTRLGLRAHLEKEGFPV